MADVGDDPTDAVARLLAGETPLRVVAVIVATVDLERAAAAIGGTVRPLAEDPLLGARVWLIEAGTGVPPAEPGERPVALVEPSTEGRLAATLARRGEGPVGRYVAARGGLSAAGVRAARAGIALSRTEPGPFGPSVLVLDGPVSGPHLVLVEPASVPSPS